MAQPITPGITLVSFYQWTQLPPAAAQRQLQWGREQRVGELGPEQQVLKLILISIYYYIDMIY